MKYFIPLFILVHSLNSYSQISQSECETIFKSADSLFKSGNYSLAIKKISAYKICANITQNKKADDLLLKIYQTVNQQKDNAITAQKEAERQTKIAQIAQGKEFLAKKEAVKAKNDAIDQKEIAEKRLKIMTSRKLLTDAISAQQESPPQWHISLLLSEQALKLNPSVESEATLRNALSHLPIFIQEQKFGEYVGSSKLSNTGKCFAISAGDDYASGGKTVVWSMDNINASIYQINEPGPFFFTNKNEYLIIGSRSNKALIVDFKNKKIICELPHKLSIVEILAISSDDKYLITKNYDVSESEAMEEAEFIFVWDIERKKVIGKIQPTNTVGKNYGAVFFFKYNGKELIGSNWSNSKTDIWEVGSSKQMSIPTINNKLLTENGKYLLNYNPDKDGFVLSSLKDTSHIIETSARVKDYKFSNSYNYVLLFFDNQVQMWNLINKGMIWGKKEAVSFPNPDDINFSPNDKYFSLYNSNEVRSVYTGEVISTNYWSESNDSLQTLLNNKIEYTIGKNLRFSDPSHTLLFSLTGDTIITSTQGGSLQFWRIKPSTELSFVKIPNERILETATSKNRQSMYFGTYYGVYRYDVTKTTIDTLVKCKRAVRAVCVSNDETLLAYGVEFETIQDEEHGVFILNLKSKTLSHINIDANISSLSFNNDGTKLLIGTGVNSFGNCECGLWIFDLKYNSKIKIDSSAAVISNYRALFYNSDSLILFTTGFDTKLITASSGKEIFKIEYGHQIGYCLKFNSILKAKDNLLSVYSIDSINNKVQLKYSKQFKGKIVSLNVSEDSSLALITIKESYQKGKVILWNYLTNEERNNFEIDGEITSADFSQMNSSNVIVCFDNKISYYSFSYNELLKSCEQRTVRSFSKLELETYLGNGFENTIGK